MVKVAIPKLTTIEKLGEAVMRRSLFRSLVALTIAVLGLSPITAAHATETSYTAINPTKLEQGSFNWTSPYWPVIINRTQNSSVGLIDGTPYQQTGSADTLLLTWGNIAAIPAGSCLSSLTLNVTGTPAEAGFSIYSFNYAKWNKTGDAAVVKSQAGYTGLMFQYRATANNSFFYSWGGFLWAPAAPNSVAEYSYSIPMDISNITTSQFKNGNFVTYVGGINAGDELKSVTIDYTVTDVECPVEPTTTPITISAATDTKDYDGTAASDGVPTVTSGELATGDELDPTTCTQSFNNANAGAEKTLSVNAGCKIVNSGTDVSEDYEITLDTADGVINQIDPTCEVTGYEVTFDESVHTATGSCTGLNDVELTGLDLSDTSHIDVGEYEDDWTFTDPNGNYTSDSGTVLSSITANTFEISFNGGAATGGSAPETFTSENGSTVTVPGNTGALTLRGYALVAWNTAQDGSGTRYLPGSTFTLEGDVTLYAEWQVVKSKKRLRSFAADSSKLKQVFKTKIAAWAENLPTGAVIVCVGSTKGKQVTADANKLAKARAFNVCNYVTKVRPDVTFTTKIHPATANKNASRHVWMFFQGVVRQS